MGFRHTPFFNFLETLQRPGCPFCRIARRAAERWLSSTLYEYVNDPNVRRSFLLARGLCREHANMLRCRHDPLGTVLLHETLVCELLAIPDRQLLDRPSKPCPVCEYVEHALRSAATTFFDNFDEPEIQATMSESFSFCFPHASWLAQHAGDKNIRATIVRGLRLRLRQLELRIREFLSAQNATLTSESASPEVDRVWGDCLDFFSGSSQKRDSSEDLQ